MEENNLIKKGVVIAVILLFFSVSVIPSTGTTDVKQITMPTSSGNTLYVGGNGTGNYSSIQDAIDDSSNGDTVYVYDDSSPYCENVVVDKSINFIGEDKNTTVIDGGGSYPVVNNHRAMWVNISGFTIRNGDTGIEIFYASYNTITDNIIISNNEWFGIDLFCSSYNTITGNNISNNGDGIYLGNSSFNTITGNIISNNRWDGIWLQSSNNNTITCNIILNNDDDGIYPYKSNNNTITGNNISNNGYGIFLEFSVFNTVLKNNFIGNKRQVHTARGNIWDKNYWNNWIGIIIKKPIFQNLPKIIWGGFFALGYLPIFPCAFDWHPAQEPYDIGV